MSFFTSFFTKGTTYDQMANAIITTTLQIELHDGLKSRLTELKITSELAFRMSNC